MVTRICTRCCEEKHVVFFYETKAGSGKYRANCRKCYMEMEKKRTGTSQERYQRELSYRAKWSEERIQERLERNRRHQRECKERKKMLNNLTNI